jgi:RNA polymerase sigma-70 factor, ECF subfamily
VKSDHFLFQTYLYTTAVFAHPPESMKYSDEEIVKKVLAGEKQFFGVLVDRYQQPVYNLMLRYTQNSDEAADLTQDAFVRTFERLSQFRADKVFFSWMYSLAINLARDWNRKKFRQNAKNHILQQEAAERQDGEDGKANIELGHDLQQVQHALMEIASQTREILILRYRHGYSVHDVASSFDLTESAVKMRIKRGLAQLRNILLDKQGQES